MSAADRANYDGYVIERLNAFHEHAGDTARVWDYGKLKRAGRPIGAGDEGAFVGPWRAVRPYVTTEFREWIDEYSAERLTFTEWLRAATLDRRAHAGRERDYLDSVEFFTDDLAHWAQLTRDRDALIVAARERGATFRDLQEATGLSRMTLHNVIAADARQLAGLAAVAA